MDTSEQWLPVVGYEGLYEVSSFGSVRSLDRFVIGRTKNGLDKKYRKPGIVLAQSEKKRHNLFCSYFAVGLGKGSGTQKQFMVHRLVAEAFIGPKPFGLDTDHKDNNPHNNRSDNLRYVTRRENIAGGKCGVLKQNRKSKLLGVNPKGKKFSCELWVKGKKKQVGVFDTEIEAGNAYLREVALADQG